MGETPEKLQVHRTIYKRNIMENLKNHGRGNVVHDGKCRVTLQGFISQALKSGWSQTRLHGTTNCMSQTQDEQRPCLSPCRRNHQAGWSSFLTKNTLRRRLEGFFFSFVINRISARHFPLIRF